MARRQFVLSRAERKRWRTRRLTLVSEVGVAPPAANAARAPRAVMAATSGVVCPLLPPQFHTLRAAAMLTTWDGLPISDEPPFGAAVVVFRAGLTGSEFLLLHRAHHGPDYAGDWAWTPPSGARLPGEPIEACAARELREETGLVLTIAPTDCGSPDWPLYVAQAPPDVAIMLDHEHDRFEWVPADQASRCLPEQVGRSLAAAARRLPQT